MADDLPPLHLDVNATGVPVVIVDGQEVLDVSGLIDLAPNIVDPRYARAYARLVNHLSDGFQFNVIMDPKAFEAEYREKYEAEDPDEVVVSGKIRLRNYPMPDFSVIEPPKFEDSTLIYFAENAYLGVPYKIEAGTAVTSIGKPIYTLVPPAKE